MELNGPVPPPRPPVSPPPDAPPIYPTGATIAACLYAVTYVWPKRGEPFWFYPTSVENGRAGGFQWIVQGWYSRMLDLGTIDGAACYKAIKSY